jgi:hypothetical protein
MSVSQIGDSSHKPANERDGDIWSFRNAANYPTFIDLPASETKHLAPVLARLSRDHAHPAAAQLFD